MWYRRRRVTARSSHAASHGAAPPFGVTNRTSTCSHSGHSQRISTRESTWCVSNHSIHHIAPRSSTLQPTPTHYFLSLLHERGLLQRVWTQNIDTLETAAGVPVDKVLEAHGSFATASCLLCKRPASTEHVFRSGVREGNVVRCSRDGCKGLVKPSIVFFGEALPEDFWIHKRVGV